MLVVWIALVGVVHMARTALRAEPPPPMPACPTCGARFLAQHGVDLHREASHPEVFDETAGGASRFRSNKRGTE